MKRINSIGKARCIAIMLVAFITSFNAVAQKDDFSILHKQWKANWITVPDEEPAGYGVYLFRKQLELPAKPTAFIIHVSADNRYKLFVNEKLVSLGPARGDITHWNYETVDISSYLHAGKNVVAAQVWNEGEWKPEAQISLRTAFILQGATSAEESLNTDSTWKCIRDKGYQPIPVHIPQPTYYVCGPGEQIDLRLRIKDWEKISYTKDSSWKNAQEIAPGVPKNVMKADASTSGWLLIPSIIPQMELKPQRLLKVRKAEGVKIPSAFPAVKTAVTIPANTVATLLLDQTFLTNTYPTLVMSGGKDAAVSLGYAESLYTVYPAKGNRDETDGKTFIGRRDRIISDGSKNQNVTPLSFRTYRYIEVKITTKATALVLEDIYGISTGYPFQFNAKLTSENPELNKILEIGWRTAKLCAVETYTDCPYYEQLQYIGDARIQGLVSLYNSGDDRLLRNALNQMDNSRLPEGITLSRHPSRTPQYIPTFSLWYIGMLHDYWMYGGDGQFIKDKLSGERQVLNYFHKFQQPDGSLKDLPYWVFTDWVTAKDWNTGVAPIGKNGNSALLDLQLLFAYQMAADMESKIGVVWQAELYNQYADQLKKTIRLKYWDNNRKLLADRPEKDLFSQHANALAILTGTVNDQEAKAIGKQLLDDKTLAPASIYFKYYLHLALVKAGMGNDYLNWLGKWRENMEMGMTTWGETSTINTTRSDCHAWGASPNIEFFRTVLGVDSDAPGFAKVKITPHLGLLKNISGEIPHPAGKIAVKYVNKMGRWTFQITLPETVTGIFVWKGKRYQLNSRLNTIEPV